MKKLTFILLILSYTVNADVYKHVNQSGQIHYADCPNGPNYGIIIHSRQEANNTLKDAKRGNPDAQYNEGCKIANNFSEAIMWFQKAAEQNHSGAQFHLGEMYFYGEGIQKDAAKATVWYKKAAALGDVDAQKTLSEIQNGTKLNVREAVLISPNNTHTVTKTRQANSSEKTALISAIKINLKDPYSAKFEDFIIVNNKHACVTVNAKNIFGGYVGSKSMLVLRTKDGWLNIGDSSGLPCKITAGLMKDDSLIN